MLGGNQSPERFAISEDEEKSPKKKSADNSMNGNLSGSSSSAVVLKNDGLQHVDNNPNNTDDKGKRKKKKKSRSGTLRKADLAAISAAMPKGPLEPIVGLNREKLPPLRSGTLPSLNKQSEA